MTGRAGGAWTTPTPSAGASGGEDAAQDECDEGVTGVFTRGDGFGGEAAVAPASTLLVANATASAEAPAAPGFVSLLQASPAPAAPPPEALAPPLVAPVAPAGVPPSLLASPAVTTGAARRGPASGAGGAAAAGATPPHSRDVPVRASAAAALVRTQATAKAL